MADVNESRTPRSARDSGGKEHPEVLDRRELQNRALRGASWTVIHTVTSVPIAFVVNILLARGLGVVDFGRLAFLMTLMNVASGVVALGVTTGTIQFGVKAHSAGRRSDVRSLLSQAQGFRLAVAAPLLTVMVLLVAHVSTPMMIVALVFGVWVPGFFDGATTCLAIENKTASGAKNAMIGNLLSQAGVVTALLLGGSADVIWATRLALASVGVALALLVVDRSYRSAVLRPRLPLHMPPQFWKFALPTAAASLIATLVLSRTEIFFLNWAADGAAVGYFALAFGLAAHIFAPAQALVGPLVPAISGLREVDVAAIAPAFLRTMRTSVVLVAGLCVLGVPALAMLIPLIYGSSFTVSAGMFVVLSVSAGLLVAAAPVSAFVMGRLAARTVLSVNLVALLVDVTLAVTVIPVLGGWGAVIANVGGALTLLFLLVNSELRSMHMPWSSLRRPLRSLTVAVVACALGWSGVSQLGLPSVAGAVLASACATGAWVTLLRLFGDGLTEADVAGFDRVMPVRFRRSSSVALAVVTTRSAV